MSALKRIKVDYKLLIKLTIPIFIEIVLQILVGNIDKLMVNNATAATAINQANTVIDMLTVSFSVLASASLILINQYKGALDKEKERKIYFVAFYFNLFLSLLICCILLIFAPQIISLLQVEKVYFDYAVTYMRISGGFIFLQSIILTLACFLRSNDFVYKSLFVSVGFNILNISLNALFLYGLKIDNPIIGVAIPSVISRFVAAIVLLILCYKYVKLDLSLKYLKTFSFTQLKKILALGLPSVGESLSYSLSQIVILAFINMISFGAPEAKTYTQIIIYFAYLFTSAASQGMQILLGRYLGGKNMDSANKLVLSTIIMSVIASIIVTGLFYIFSIPLFQFMVPDTLTSGVSKDEVVKLCSLIMQIEIVLEIGRAVNICLVRGLQTCGDVFFPTILAIIFCWVVAVVGSYILGVHFNLGILGVWISMTIDELIRAFIFLIRWFKGGWKKYDLVK